jgi:hypothetical protein
MRALTRLVKLLTGLIQQPLLPPLSLNRSKTTRQKCNAPNAQII